jgi:hypothetical protein
MIPEEYAKILFAKIQGSGLDKNTGLRTVPCDIDENLETKFIIGNEEYIMPAKDLAFERVNDTNACIAGIQGGAIDIDAWVLGDTFIKVYIVCVKIDKYYVLKVVLIFCIYLPRIST